MDQLNDELPPDLAKAFGALDARAQRRAAQVDAGRVAEGVVARLRRAADDPPLGFGGGVALRRMVRVAAALAVLITGGAIGVRMLRHPGAAPAPAWAPGLDDHAVRALTVAGTDSIIKAVDQVRALNTAAPAASASVEQLTTQELRALLQAMQSSEEGSL